MFPYRADAFSRAVFGTLHPRLVTASAADKYIIRLHTPEKNIQFCRVNQGAEKNLSRLLYREGINAHTVLTEGSWCDFFADIEREHSSWFVAQKVLNNFVQCMQETFEEHDIQLKKILILDSCSNMSKGKMSFHVHVKCNAPFRGKGEVAYLLNEIRSKMTLIFQPWLDSMPAITGSLRLMNAKTKLGIRRLVALDLMKLDSEYSDLFELLKKYQPIDESERMKMSLIKRFEDVSTTPIRVERREQSFPSIDDYSKTTKEIPRVPRNFQVDNLLDDGTIRRLLEQLPVEYAANFTEWSKVLWALKCLANQNLTVCLYIE